jgi:hypothetical protein
LGIKTAQKFRLFYGIQYLQFTITTATQE